MNNPMVVMILDIYQQVQLGGGVLGDQGREGGEKETCGTENDNKNPLQRAKQLGFTYLHL